ncbi:hypothetical protein GCM10010272_69230 [Streptomyces lateritius]|nr:hypothetical protein GCM10010272_69230 [Streptomyces lateritius]
MKFPRLAVTATAVVSAGLFAWAQAPTASAATFTAELVARHSQKCVTIQSSSTANDAAVIQFDCVPGGQSNQQWKLVATSAGYYSISAMNSGRCMTVKDASVQDYAQVIQYGCGNNTNQQWRLVQKDNGYFSIEARHSGKCLTVTSASNDNDTALIQYDCVEGTNQHFRLG